MRQTINGAELRRMIISAAASVEIHKTADDIPWSLDGEYAPSSPVVNIENCHGAVRLLVKKPEGNE